MGNFTRQNIGGIGTVAPIIFLNWFLLIIRTTVSQICKHLNFPTIFPLPASRWTVDSGHTTRNPLEQISPATDTFYLLFKFGDNIIFTYLLPTLNTKTRPKLWYEQRRGDRRVARVHNLKCSPQLSSGRALISSVRRRVEEWRRSLEIARSWSHIIEQSQPSEDWMMVEQSAADLPSFVLYPSDIDKIELLKLVFKLSTFYISTALQYQSPSMSILLPYCIGKPGSAHILLLFFACHSCWLPKRTQKWRV